MPRLKISITKESVSGHELEPEVSIFVDTESTDLLAWWLKTSIDDYEQGAPKVDEYGAHDLEIMGSMLLVFGYKDHIDKILRDGASGNLPLGTELACWFYLLGKVSRLLSDYLAHRKGKADTWHDITFYSMMARRIQETGQWP